MRDYANEICLFALSAAILAIPSGDPLGIMGFLSAVVVTCASASRMSLRIATQIAFLICSCFSFSFLAFLPVIVYFLMHERYWILHLLWLVPIAVWCLFDWPVLEGVWLLVLCCVSCVLAVSNRRLVSERKGLTHAYDNLRERMVTIADGANDSSEDASESEHMTTLFEDLSPRESAVAQLVAEGLDNREISQRLFLSEGTVRNYISSILSKKGLENRTQIAVMYYTS